MLRDLLAEGLQTEVIFETAYDKYAIDAIRFSALDYLLKPVSPFDLQNALIRFLGKAAGTSSNAAIHTLLEKTLKHSGKLKFSTHSGFFVISPENIVYIHADWNYSEIFLAGGKQELVTINIGKLEEMLLDKSFCRISRSVIVNTDYVVRVNRRKRTVELSHNGNEYSFKVPLLNIRRIEQFIYRGK